MPVSHKRLRHCDMRSTRLGILLSNCDNAGRHVQAQPNSQQRDFPIGAKDRLPAITRIAPGLPAGQLLSPVCQVALEPQQQLRVGGLRIAGWWRRHCHQEKQHQRCHSRWRNRTHGRLVERTSCSSTLQHFVSCVDSSEGLRLGACGVATSTLCSTDLTVKAWQPQTPRATWSALVHPWQALGQPAPMGAPGWAIAIERLEVASPVASEVSAALDLPAGSRRRNQSTSVHRAFRGYTCLETRT